jgi:hypothetical protein
MKQVFSLLGGVSLLLCLCLFACQKTNDVPATDTPSVSNEAVERGIQQPAPICNCGATVKLQAHPPFSFPVGAKVLIFKRNNCADPICTFNPIPVLTLTGTTPKSIPNVGCNTCYTAVGDYPNTFPVDVVVTNINGAVVVGTVSDSNHSCNGINSLAFSASGTCDAN